MPYFDVLLVLFAFGSVIDEIACIEYDNQLTEKQAKILFHRNADDVPEYHSIHVETITNHRSRRSTENYFRLVQFQVKQEKHVLKLFWRKRSVFPFTSTVWTIASTRNQSKNYIYKVIEEPNVYFDGIFFEDRGAMGIFLAHYDKKRRQLLYNGVFGLGTEKHILRSIPEKWKTAPQLKNNCELCTSSRFVEHLTYKTKYQNESSRSLFLVAEDPESNDILDVPFSVLYIKILPVIDNELFKLLNENIEETLKYVATFWNVVDLQFSKISVLKVEIIITGVIIAVDDHALTFIDKSRDNMDPHRVYAYELLEEARMHFYHTFFKDTNFTNYDAIFVMTALNTKPTAGMSYIGRICNRVYSTAFIQDDANFLGLSSATHELGHLLNFVHDGSDRAKTCDPYPNECISTIMAPVVRDSKLMVWSRCSQNSLTEFIKTKGAKCLKEKYRG